MSTKKDFQTLNKGINSNQYLLNWQIALGLIAIAIGLIIFGWLLNQGIMNFKKGERIVTVKGISERLVTSDLVVWNLSFKNSGDDLALLNNKTQEDHKTIISFLNNFGFTDNEIKDGEVTVVDKMAREYGDQPNITNRYIISNNLTIRTNKVDLILKVLSKITMLIEKGIVISGAPNFHYTKFFDLRPEMLAEATQSARKAALQFASDSASKVGSIKTASQGLFNISPRDSFEENVYGGEYSSVEKKIRVVCNITFNLE